MRSVGGESVWMVLLGVVESVLTMLLRPRKASMVLTRLSMHVCLKALARSGSALGLMAGRQSSDRWYDECRFSAQCSIVSRGDVHLRESRR